MVTNSKAALLSGHEGWTHPMLRLGDWLLHTLTYRDLSGGYYPLAFTNLLEIGWPCQAEAEL